MKRQTVIALLLLLTLTCVMTLPAFAAQPDNPTERAEKGSFNKSETGLERQADAASIHDGPAEPHVRWD